MQYRYLNHKEINKILWDQTVSKSFNTIAYAYSWYLDVISPGWAAIVDDEYKTIMPIPTKSKYGICYSLQPKFMQQGGVFSQDKVAEDELKLLINAIPKKYKYIILNFTTDYYSEKHLFQSRGLTMHLNLSDSYKDLWKNYGSNTKRNIKKSLNYSLKYSENIKSDELINFLKETGFKSLSGINNHDFLILKQLLDESINRDFGNIYGVRDKDENLLAATFLLKSHKKVINVLNMSSKSGYKYNAMFFLFDSYFKANSSSDLLFDFEGSSIEGVARFYKGFGSEVNYFPILKINRLPFYLKIFKK